MPSTQSIARLARQTTFTCCGLILALFIASCHDRHGPGGPLEGTAELILLLMALAGLLVLGLVGGLIIKLLQPKVIELVGSQLTKDHALLVTDRTGIVFPAGTKLVGLCHLHESLDTYVATKFELPPESVPSFMTNDFFRTAEKRPPHFELGSSTTWWKRNRLAGRTDRTWFLASGRYIECCMGTEGDLTVVYVSWA